MNNMKAYIAEFFGTFVLSIAVMTALSGATFFPGALVAGITLGLFVYTIGSISGAHLNPAITFGLWSIGKIEPKQAAGYMVAQFLGGAVAMLDARARELTPTFPLSVIDSVPVAAIEAGGAFILAFAVAAVVFKRVAAEASGLAIGGSLFLGATIASALSNGVLNPAVALGIGSFSIAYLAGPLLGAFLGMQLYTWLIKD